MQDPIIVCGQTIGVDSYLGTSEQAEIVTHALISFGHVLKDGSAQVKRVRETLNNSPLRSVLHFQTGFFQPTGLILGFRGRFQALLC